MASLLRASSPIVLTPVLTPVPSLPPTSPTPPTPRTSLDPQAVGLSAMGADDGLLVEAVRFLEEHDLLLIVYRRRLLSRLSQHSDQPQDPHEDCRYVKREL